MLRHAIALALVAALPLAAAAETGTATARSYGNYLSSKANAADAIPSSANPAAAKSGEPNRQARYKEQQQRFAPASEAQQNTKAETLGDASVVKSHRDPLFANKAAEPPRPADAPLRSSSHSFELWDAGRSLISDVDADGYFRRFEIRFDADVSTGDALVYAKLYLRRVGDSGPWQHYFSTDDFWIYGTSDSDDYYVETVLNDGYPTAEYDVLIDLYEAGYSGIVATIGPFEDSSLRDLPLEDVGLDMPVPNAGYQILDVDTTLLTDADRDGYYSRFSISFDPDRDHGASMAYAVLRVRREGDDWQTEHTSATFQVDESGDADRFTFTADWQSGYPTGRYDIQIDLYDAATQLLVATVSSERPELSRVPLEDADRDTGSSGGGGGGGGDSESRGSGGGATGGLLMAVLLGLFLLRRRLPMARVAPGRVSH